MKKILLFITLINAIGFNSKAQMALSFNTTQPSCYGSTNGAIDLTVTGDTLPITYNWYLNGNFYSNQEDLTSIPAGQYIIIVADSITSVSDTVYLSAPFELVTVDTILDAPCYNGNGTINITPEDTNQVYVGILYPINWDEFNQVWYIDSSLVDTAYTNSGDTIHPFQMIWSPVAGFYTLYVYENFGSGCGKIIDIEIKEPSAPLSINKTYEHNICKGGNNAFISVVPKGGTLPYTYAWSTGVATPSITGLYADLYTITVRDGNGCSIVETIDIEEPFQDILLYTDTMPVSCRDQQDGSAEIRLIENALPPYTYSWTGPDGYAANTSIIAELDSGYYSVVVTDANNCSVTVDYHIGMLNEDCIVIYNVITPDGNGKNDVWEIRNIHLYPDADVAVFNRWGEQVFSAKNGYDNTWDGKYKGSYLNSGDYYYVVNLNIGDYPPYTGPIKILK